MQSLDVTSPSQAGHKTNFLKSGRSPTRQVRVFISSTFQDMYGEREELVKNIFPQLRQLCERRHVSLSEVDLRWGIPQEDVNAEKVLPICLEEVTNCRPFFIALLGNRYGTTVKRIPEQLLDSEPWLKDHVGASMSELEILHGALNAADEGLHAFFYLRNSGSHAVDDEGSSRLTSLKQRILNSSFPVKHYTTPSELGQMVLEDLSTIFTEMFPLESLPDSLQQEEAEHDAFAESRALVYVGQQRYFDQLDEFVASERPPLIVTGSTGAGKSSLLANWARRRLGHAIQLEAPSLVDRVRGGLRYLTKNFGSEATSDAVLLAHFVGASAASANRSAMLRRVLETMRVEFSLQLTVPDRPALLPLAFANYLQALARRGKLILILDGIDQLSDDLSTSTLAWLPAEIPTNIRVILSVPPGDTLDELLKRDCPVLRIKPLPPTEREALVTRYLAHYRKRLDHPLTKRLCSSDRAANPLYLRTVLEELRVFGRQSHELPELVEHLLAAEGTNELFGKFLDRLEKDYREFQPHKRELVSTTMQLLWAAREGLSEGELAELLGTPDGPLPSTLWSPLYLATKEFLINRSGLLSFFHHEFRNAIERRYLPDEDQKESAHRQLAEYFTHRGSEYRRTAELPWQLVATNSWRELSSLLSTPEFLINAWPVRQFDLKSYWAAIEARSSYRMVTAYAPILEAPARFDPCLVAVCTLLSDAGYVKQALRLSTYLEDAARKRGDNFAVQASLSTRAALLKRNGDVDEALALLKEQEQLCRDLQNWAGLASSLGNQSVILLETGYLDEALSLNKREEAICRRIEDLSGLSSSLGNQGVILHKKSDLKQALICLQEQERICRLLGDLAGLQKSLGNQGLILHSTGESDRGLALLKEDAALCRRLGDFSSLHVCLGNQGVILASMGDYDQSLELYREKEAICEEIGDMRGLVRSLCLQASLFAEKLRQPQFAVPLIEKARSIAKQNGLMEMIQQIDGYSSQ